MTLPTEVYQEMLVNIRQESDESIIKFPHRVSKLAFQAYPNKMDEAESKGVLAFLKGCRYKDACYQTLAKYSDGKISTIEEAATLVQINSHHLQTIYGNDKKVRTISAGSNVGNVGSTAMTTPNIQPTTFNNYIERDVKSLQNDLHHMFDKFQLLSHEVGYRYGDHDSGNVTPDRQPRSPYRYTSREDRYRRDSSSPQRQQGYRQSPSRYINYQRRDTYPNHGYEPARYTNEQHDKATNYGHKEANTQNQNVFMSREKLYKNDSPSRPRIPQGPEGSPRPRGGSHNSILKNSQNRGFYNDKVRD